MVILNNSVGFVYGVSTRFYVQLLMKCLDPWVLSHMDSWRLAWSGDLGPPKTQGHGVRSSALQSPVFCIWWWASIVPGCCPKGTLGGPECRLGHGQDGHPCPSGLRKLTVCGTFVCHQGNGLCQQGPYRDHPDLSPACLAA